MADEHKVYIGANDLLLTSYQMAAQILKREFYPDFIVAIWRGGTPVGIAVQEFMAYLGITTDHIAVRTSSYEGMEQKRKVRVHNLGYLVSNLNADNKLLIVDDVFDTGKSVVALLKAIRKKARLNMAQQIKVATPYYKPSKNVTDFEPDFYVHKTEDWLVFPHELCGLTKEEINANKPEVGGILSDFVEGIKN